MWYEKHSLNILDFFIEEKYFIKIYIHGNQSDCVEYKGFTFKRAETGAITICSDFVISRRSKEKNRLVFNFLRDINTVDTELLLKYKKGK